MAEVDIQLKDDQLRFYTGDPVSGTALVTLPEDVPTTGILLAFICMGDVKWRDSSHDVKNSVAYNQHIYHEEVLHDTDSESCPAQEMDGRRMSIPFHFTIPKDLPSTMLSKDGYVRYIIRLTLNPGRTHESKFFKELSVHTPIEQNLMVTVAASSEKLALLHGGKIFLSASLSRKGYAPGEAIQISISVDNRSTARVTPRATLHKVETFKTGARHRTMEATVCEEPVIGAEMPAKLKTDDDELIIRIPGSLALSIKSSVVTLKYFVHVTLDIPHSFDLHVNLPIVITSPKSLERVRQNRGLEAKGSHDPPSELLSSTSL